MPAKGEGLEALWDRFVIRIESRPIKLEKNFRAMLLEAPTDFLGPTDFTDSTDSSGSMGKSDSADFSDLKITAEEYAEWTERIDKIGVKIEVLAAISAIRKSLR